MALPHLSPAAYRRITMVALLALVFIVITGGAVRLTGSGLGCPDWPQCDKGRLIAPLELHPMVEFINRVVTGVVSMAVAIAVLGARRRIPYRRDLFLLALGLVGGVVAQIILGGLTVLFELAPPFVIGHFLVSMVLLANAAVLHHRAGLTHQANGDDRPTNRVRVPVAGITRVLVILAAVVVFTGTLVTAAGPHGGDEKAERLPASVESVARVHGSAVFVFLGLTLYAITQIRKLRRDLQQEAELLLVVICLQGGLGYLQYFSGVPPLLVGVHIAGACAVWLTTLRLHLAAGQPAAKTALKKASDYAENPRRRTI